MVDEFSLPSDIIDRKVTKMKMISPSNREVDVGRTLSDKEYIGMCRREILDSYLRKRATDLGTKVINGLVMRLEQVPTPLPRSFPPQGILLVQSLAQATLERQVKRGCGVERRA